MAVCLCDDACARARALSRPGLCATALVTGGSSGIGAAIVRKLAGQGINVVVAALPDAVLTAFMTSVRAEYPTLQFVACRTLGAPRVPCTRVRADRGLGGPQRWTCRRGTTWRR
jgi:hypothetical protein